MKIGRNQWQLQWKKYLLYIGISPQKTTIDGLSGDGLVQTFEQRFTEKKKQRNQI